MCFGFPVTIRLLHDVTFKLKFAESALATKVRDLIGTIPEIEKVAVRVKHILSTMIAASAVATEANVEIAKSYII